MTLNIVEGHLFIASLFKCDISSVARCAVPLHLQSFLFVLAITPGHYLLTFFSVVLAVAVPRRPL